MSKIGKMPITIPAGVTVTYANGVVTVKGPKGELQQQIRPEVTVTVGETVETSIGHDDHKKYRGLTRTLIANMIQ
jgi:large subunit ribosomal protein L6